MKEVSLEKMGFPGYILREDGTIKRPNGTIIEKPYATGQVSMYGIHGPESRNLSRMVAYYFVPNPEGYMALRFKDGNRLNCKASNLEWAEKRGKRGKGVIYQYRGEIIIRHVNGERATTIAGSLGLNYTAVCEVIDRFEQEVAESRKNS